MERDRSGSFLKKHKQKKVKTDREDSDWMDLDILVPCNFCSGLILHKDWSGKGRDCVIDNMLNC